MTRKGIVFDIQRYSIHDGPGVRTLVFLKGCPLSCKWCSNPEGQKSHAEIRFIASKCIGEDKCKAPCVKACPHGAIALSKEGRPETSRKLCQTSGKCVEACLYGARQLSGKTVTVEELMTEVLKDAPFYRNSGGGVTIGGGEPLTQSAFAREFLKSCKERALHTALETCGYVPWKHLEATLEFVGFVFYDIKHMDEAKHKELTGMSNRLILENAKNLLATKKAQVIVRIPVIPGLNDSEENVAAIARFVAEAGGKVIELLPYHRLGVSKHKQLDMTYELNEVPRPSEESMQRLSRIVRSVGIDELYGDSRCTGS